MMRPITYGDRRRLELDLSAERIVGDFSSGRCQPLDDAVAAVAAALIDPLDFPPLSTCTVPGDRIVLAVDRDVPQAAAVVAGVVQTLLDAGAAPRDIAIVVAAEMSDAARDSVTGLLPETSRGDIRVERHDPVDRPNLMYLTASKANKPIYFNRLIGDADVVIPIGAMRLESSLGYVGVHGGLFPAFSDDDTRRRFLAPSSTDWSALHQRRHEEASEAAWLLGVQFTLQVIPGPGDSILHVLSGDANRVAHDGQRMCEVAWQHESERRADLVVATIDGSDEHQTWENVGRALFAASQVVGTDGTIVICTSLRQPPGPSLQRLAAPDAPEDILHELRRDRTHDAVTAALLLDLRQRHRIYLLSDLDAELVEDLGIGHVNDPQQIARLGQQHDSCILLANAHHAMVRAMASV